MTPALRFLSNQVWAIHPPVFDILSALLESRANGERTPSARDGDSPGGGEPGPQIIGDTAVIPVRGVIARYADQINGNCQDAGRSAESLQRDLLAMAADPNVKRIVLRIDSPGGTVAGTSETADAIRRVSAGGKPVIAFVDGMAASAAYWLASQADKIVMAGPTSEVGSIGVITAHVDQTRLQENRGVKVQVFRTSPLKAPGAMGETLSLEQARAIDRDLADFHAVFAGGVQAGRGMTDEQIAAATTGEMWRPEAAIAMGLADEMMSWDQLMASAAKLPTTKHTISMPAVTSTAGFKQPLKADIAKESMMHVQLMAAMAALALSHPSLSSELIAEAAKPDATPELLTAFANTRSAALADEAKTKELVDTKAALEQSQTEAKAAATELATLKADHAKLLALAKGAPQDPGLGAPPASKIRSSMTSDEKGAFIAAHGADAYSQLPA